MSYEQEFRNPENGFSIPIQKIHIADLNDLKSSVPNVKIVECHDLQTSAYALFPFYKPISKVIPPHNE